MRIVVDRRSVGETRTAEPDANGVYVHHGMHNGQPAYRKEFGSSNFWICNITSENITWALCKGFAKILYTNGCSQNQQQGTHSNLFTGFWLNQNGEILCRIERHDSHKAILLADRNVLLCCAAF